MRKSAVCAIIAENQILLLKRIPRKDKSNGWCLPGGKIEDGEAIIDGAIRETWEETTIKVSDITYAGKEISGNKEFTVSVYVKVLSEKPGVLVNIFEHTEHSWVPLDRIDDYALAGNTGKFIDLALKKMKSARLTPSKPAPNITGKVWRDSSGTQQIAIYKN